MIINGGSRAGAGELAAHLGRTDTNEAVELLEVRGVATRDLREGLRQMEGIAAGTRCRKSLYHANIDPDPGAAPLTGNQQRQAIDRLERGLRLIGHPRIVVAHVKHGRRHLHVVWSRIDQATMKAVHDGHNYRVHEKIARELEAEFGHPTVPGVHHQPADAPRLKPWQPSGAKAAETQQAERTGIDPAAVTLLMTQLWHQADTGRAFKAAVTATGYVLARGDRRDFCLVDPTGGVHSLARRLTGVRAAAVRLKLQDIDIRALPSVQAARAACRSRGEVTGLVSVPTPAAGTSPQSRISGDKTAVGLMVVSRLDRTSTAICEAPPRLAAAGGRPAAASHRPQQAGIKSARVETELVALTGRSGFVTTVRRPGRPPLPFSSPPPLVLKEPRLAPAPGCARLRPVPTRKEGSTAVRPVFCFRRAVGLEPPYELVMWAIAQKRALIAYSNETGAYVVPELNHLTAIITGAYLELGLTATGKQKLSGSPAPGG